MSALSGLGNLGILASVHFPTLGELAGPINILIDLALAALLLYILLVARKGR